MYFDCIDDDDPSITINQPGSLRYDYVCVSGLALFFNLQCQLVSSVLQCQFCDLNWIVIESAALEMYLYITREEVKRVKSEFLTFYGA